jgi:hypothetical protein
VVPQPFKENKLVLKNGSLFILTALKPGQSFVVPAIQNFTLSLILIMQICLLALSLEEFPSWFLRKIQTPPLLKQQKRC